MSRHPCDRGTPFQRNVTSALRALLDGRTWRRHPAPFAKTIRGLRRRQERLFARHMDWSAP